MRQGKLLLAGLIAILTTSCVTVTSQVVRFHEIGPDDKGKTFVVYPYGNQKGSLEFRQYAQVISGYMKQNDFVPAGSYETADYAVVLKYAISDGQTVTGSIPIQGQTGGGTTYSSGSVSGYAGSSSVSGTYSGTSYTEPTYGVVGSIPYTKTNYTRAFRLEIIDIKKSTSKKLHSVFESKVTSTGSSGTFAKVSDCMIAAVFRNFPGKSGASESVVFDGNSCLK